MLTIGVDLAAEPARTALAGIWWNAGGATLISLQLGIDDAEIVDVSEGATSIGVDCAFGWPIEFTRFLTSREREQPHRIPYEGRDLRRRLAYRETDRVVRGRTGRWPLSVSTDRLGMTAIRCAELLDEFQARGETVDRSGAGRHVEVYPAAALRHWRLLTPGYKTKPDAKAEAARILLDAVPWLTTTAEQRALLAGSDDALDALVACLNARAHERGATLPVPPDLAEHARIEGWIALPTGEIRDLQLDPQPEVA